MNPRIAWPASASRPSWSLAHGAGWFLLACVGASLLPEWAWAQASPFTTGATAAQTNILAILTPIAVIGVMALGVAALTNKISWGWVVGGIAGVALIFGGPQIVAWIRTMFGV